MPKQYDVKQGDYLSKIAAENGFSDYRIIWNHAKNKELKEKRKNPNVLFPGDVLHIPDKEEKEEPRATDQQHIFELAIQPLKLRIVVKDVADKPVAGKPCQLIVDGSPDVPSLTSDGEGLVEREIKETAATGRLILKDAGLPIDLNLPLQVGDLDPVEERSGWQARLNNLGYNAGEVDGKDSPQLRSAIEEFQCDHNLKVDGDCGPKTQAKLKEVHGC